MGNDTLVLTAVMDIFESEIPHFKCPKFRLACVDRINGNIYTTPLDLTKEQIGDVLEVIRDKMDTSRELHYCEHVQLISDEDENSRIIQIKMKPY